MKNFYRIAFRNSFKGTYHEPWKRMAACIVKGGQVLSVACNAENKHAEARAIRPHRNYEGATIYVARTNDRVSKPCPKCMDKILASGITSICYVNRDGRLVKESVRR